MCKLREENRPYGKLNLPALDRMLQSMLVESSGMLMPGDWLCFWGPGHCGKSALLYYFALTRIVPVEIEIEGEKVAVGGRKESVLWINADGRFEILRLMRMLKAHFDRCIRMAKVNADDRERNEFIMDCLSRVAVLQWPCKASDQILIDLGEFSQLRTIIADPVNDEVTEMIKEMEKKRSFVVFSSMRGDKRSNAIRFRLVHIKDDVFRVLSKDQEFDFRVCEDGVFEISEPQ